MVLSEAESLQLSLALSRILPCPMLWLLVHLHGPCWVWSCPWRLTLDPFGWGWSLCRRLLFAPCSRRHLLSWLSSLRLRVFGSYWFSPLCFPDCGYASKAPCTALPPVSRLSFGLGEFSFWLGLGLCMPFLWRPGDAGALTVALTAVASLREF